MKVLVIIPAYNEELNIKKVVSNLIDHYPQYNYVVVNDGSADSTSQICHQEGYNIIDLPVNLGLAGAFQTGHQLRKEGNNIDRVRNQEIT